MTLMLRLSSPVLVAGMTGLMLASCRHYAPMEKVSFQLILSPDRNISALDIAHEDKSQLVKLINPEALTCAGANEFKEYNPRAKVVIRDGKNRQIGLALLGEGKIMDTIKSKTGIQLYRGCSFEMEIPLSAQSRVYRVDIANGKHSDYLHVSSLAKNGGKILIDLD